MTSRALLRTLLSLSILLSAPPLMAQPTITEQSNATMRVQLEIGQTRLLRLTQKIVRVSIADPNVADVRVVTPLQVLLTSKSVGLTHLILWGETDKPLVITVDCRRNLDELRTQIQELFPDEKIKVGSVGELVVLSGKVNDLRIPTRIAEVAKLHSKQLANLVEVSGDQQVQLEVRFAEVSRSGLRQMGVNMLWGDTGKYGSWLGGMNGPGSVAGQTLGQNQYIQTAPITGANISPPLLTPATGGAFNFLFATGNQTFPFSSILSILVQQGLAKVLAEPTLVALSGQEASFHAGGEIPIVISQQFGFASVQFKKFGVILKFTPTVLGGKTMSLKINSEVSEPDSTLGVIMQGFQIPGFKTRNSATTIRLKDGQSFAIAGLLSDSIRSTINKVPLLGEIPVLGALFRSSSYQRTETELLVVVKAHLTQPVQMAEAPLLPGEDELNDPSDFQLFLLGTHGPWKKEREEKKKSEQSSADSTPASGGGPSGPIGFMRE
jgi:pilus assembly protein CpaC